jgi:glyoxylase-like metal-dependent hydrolase (beta-lactamase superfamily II)
MTRGRRVPAPLPSNSVVLFDGPGEATVIDSGYVTDRAQTVELVRRAIEGRRLSRLVNTHCHSDHIGGNAALVRVFGCSVSIPRGEAEVVAAWDDDALLVGPAGQQCERFAYDATLQAGDVLRMGRLEWEAIAAPGHDMDALVFYARAARVLISGDALWEDGFGVLFPELFGEPGLAGTRATLDAIAALEIETVIPGHGPVFSDVGGALERAYARLEAFERDPGRITRHALRVLVAFHVLERQTVSLESVAALLGHGAFFAALNERSYRLDPPALAETIVRELASSGAVRIADGLIRPGR